MPTKINITITMKKVLLLTITILKVALLNATSHPIVVCTSTFSKDTSNTKVIINQESTNDTIYIISNT